jgi:hypothetical protein
VVAKAQLAQHDAQSLTIRAASSPRVVIVVAGSHSLRPAAAAKRTFAVCPGRGCGDSAGSITRTALLCACGSALGNTRRKMIAR